MAILLCALMVPGAGHAAPTDTPTRQSLRAAEARAAAEKAAAEVSTEAREAAEAAEQEAAERRVKAAEAATEAEASLSAVTDQLQAAEAARKSAETDAAQKAAALAPLLPVMRRLSLWPAETLLALPAPPEEALRGTLVLRSMGRKLRQEAEAVQQAENRAEAARAKAAQEQTRLTEARTVAARASATLEQELAEARARRGEAADGEKDAKRRAEAAISRAGDLRDALDRLERAQARAEAEAKSRAAAESRRLAETRQQEERETKRRESLAMAQPKPEETARPGPTPAMAAPPLVARNGRVAPVAGRVLRDYGDVTDAGPARGLTYATLPGARVVAPCGGRTAFAGAFRSYGQLLIVDCGGGYHFVLAGLDRLDAETGQRVLAGEPVGVLGTDGAGGRATLYVELRRNGQPVDPKGWYGGRS